MRPSVQTEIPVVHLAWLGGGKYLLSLERFGGLTLWDATTGAARHQAQATGHQPHSLAPHPDGRRFATAAMHISTNPLPAQLWSESGGRLKCQPLPAACGLYGGLAFTPDGTALIGGGPSFLTGRKQLAAQLRRWEVGLAKPGLEFVGHRSCVEAVVVWPDGRRVASAGLDRSVRVWDGTTGKAVASRRLGAGVWRLALSPDGRHLAAVVAKSPHVALLEMAGKKLSPPHELRGHTEPVAGVAFAPDGRLASVGHDGRLCLWGPDGSLQDPE
jgi:WD40 repeat protein